MEKRSIRMGVNEVKKLVLFLKKSLPGVKKFVIIDNSQVV
jgi:hypothetical protein